MTPREELDLILKLIKKYNLPLSPILEYALNEKKEEYTEATNVTPVMTKLKETNVVESVVNTKSLIEVESYTIKANDIAMVLEDEPIFGVNKGMKDYELEFANLSVGVSKGRKLPHKAILLMALMDLIETGVITDNRIELDYVIANEFKSKWNKYFDIKVPTVWTPFFHLKGESFWHFKANGNEDKLKDLLSFGGTPSIGKMRPIIKYAYLDKALFCFMKNEGCRDKLRKVLLETFIKQE